MLQKRTRWNWAALLLLVMLAGCGGNREAALIGNWKVNANNMQIPDNAAAQPQINALRAMWSAVALDLRADKTYTLNMILVLEGTWSFNPADGLVSLTPIKVNGRDIGSVPGADNGRHLIFKLSDDNRQLSMQQTDNPTMSAAPPGTAIVFEKQ